MCICSLCCLSFSPFHWGPSLIAHPCFRKSCEQCQVTMLKNSLLERVAQRVYPTPAMSMLTSPPYRHALNLQKSMIQLATDDGVAPSDRVKAALAWNELEGRKRSMRGIPEPGRYSPGAPPRKSKSSFRKAAVAEPLNTSVPTAEPAADQSVTPPAPAPQ